MAEGTAGAAAFRGAFTAAPGSKTLQIAEAAGHTAEIVAVELNRGRFFKLRANLQAYGASHVRTFLQDGSRLWRHRPEYFDRGPVNLVVECDHPEDVLVFRLATRPHLLDALVESLAGFGQIELNRDITLNTLTTVEMQPGLEQLRVHQVVRRLRLPQSFDDLTVDAVYIGGFCGQAGSLCFPIVF
ncbi:MAG: hypothetical protein IIB38_06665, partial [Candidatus Hydrogenedentes bacterium]|nr:hypothetical protein [Candidatus Hydrogenedentota bacterium]